MGQSAGDTVPVEEAIVAYVVRHPEAGDTVEGVAAWWLPEAELAYNLPLVQRALEHLVEAHRLKRATMPGGRVIYSAATDKRWI
jgi:hypothetical protein